MRFRPAFDEVMIVNPYDPRSPSQGEHYMTLQPPSAPGLGYCACPGHGPPRSPFEGAGYGHDPGVYQAPAYGYAGEAAPGYAYAHPYGAYPGHYGSYPEVPPSYGYPEAPAYGVYAEAPGYQPPLPPQHGQYAFAPPAYGEYAPPSAYAGSPAYGAPAYAETPAYARPEETYGAPEESAMHGYVRQPPRCDGNCASPLNVAGYQDEAPGLEGYLPTAGAGAACAEVDQHAVATEIPANFRPLF